MRAQHLVPPFTLLQALLNKNATVIILGRSEVKAREAMARLEQETEGTGELLFVMLDLEDLSTVRRGSEEVARSASLLSSLRPLETELMPFAHFILFLQQVLFARHAVLQRWSHDTSSKLTRQTRTRPGGAFASPFLSSLAWISDIFSLFLL